MWKNVHPVYCAGIQTHDLSNMRCHPKPLCPGSHPNILPLLIKDGARSGHLDKDGRPEAEGYRDVRQVRGPHGGGFAHRRDWRDREEVDRVEEGILSLWNQGDDFSVISGLSFGSFSSCQKAIAWSFSLIISFCLWPSADEPINCLNYSQHMLWLFFFKKKLANPGLFCLFSCFSNHNSNINWKSIDVVLLIPTQGPKDGKRRWVHWAMVAATTVIDMKNMLLKSKFWVWTWR